MAVDLGGCRGGAAAGHARGHHEQPATGRRPEGGGGLSRARLEEAKGVYPWSSSIKSNQPVYYRDPLLTAMGYLL